MYLLLLFFAVESDSPRIWAVWQEKKREVEEEEVQIENLKFKIELKKLKNWITRKSTHRCASLTCITCLTCIICITCITYTTCIIWTWVTCITYIPCITCTTHITCTTCTTCIACISSIACITFDNFIYWKSKKKYELITADSPTTWNAMHILKVKLAT